MENVDGQGSFYKTLADLSYLLMLMQLTKMDVTWFIFENEILKLFLKPDVYYSRDKKPFIENLLLSMKSGKNC